MLSIVARATAQARGQQVDEAADAAIRAAVEDQIETESLPLMLSKMLHDDGVMDPCDTRTLLIICLRTIANGPINEKLKLSVFCMYANGNHPSVGGQQGRDRPQDSRHLSSAGV